MSQLLTPQSLREGLQRAANLKMGPAGQYRLGDLSRDELIAFAANAMVELAQMQAHLATIEASRPFTTRVAMAANEDHQA